MVYLSEKEIRVLEEVIKTFEGNIFVRKPLKGEFTIKHLKRTSDKKMTTLIVEQKRKGVRMEYYFVVCRFTELVVKAIVKTFIADELEIVVCPEIEDKETFADLVERIANTYDEISTC
jgi:predicted site-specific integrase-resolvase